QTGTVGLNIQPVQPRGVESEVPFGSTYSGGFSIRPGFVERYFLGKSDPGHHRFAYFINHNAPIPISRHLVAFQLRYLQVPEGQVEGSWVKEQSISHRFKTVAVEVTMTARTEIKGNKDSAERLVTLASVIRPRFQPGSASAFGSAPPSNGSGVPGGTTGGGTHTSDGSGVTSPAYRNRGSTRTDETGSDPLLGP